MKKSTVRTSAAVAALEIAASFSRTATTAAVSTTGLLSQRRPFPGLVDLQLTAVNVLSIHCINCFICVSFVFKCDKSESAGTA